LEISKVYTDGACSGNPGPGGWGVVVYFDNHTVHEMGGFERETTNNRMELQAAIAALEFVNQYPASQPVQLYTDSEYVKKGATQWLSGWKRKNWKTSQGKPVLNQDLWEDLDRQQPGQVQWFYVKGHSGDPGNERCDTIARNFAQTHTSDLMENLPTAAMPTKTISRFQDPVSDQTPSEDIKAVKPMEFVESHHETADISADQLRMQHLTHLLDTLRIAKEIADQGYLITSSELAELMHVHPSAVTSRGEEWGWRNWQVSRVRRESNQILWCLKNL
jgi:ribonuclease HI